jgi:hypothetical protein
MAQQESLFAKEDWISSDLYLCTAEVRLPAHSIFEGAGEGAEIWGSRFSQCF